MRDPAPFAAQTLSAADLAAGDADARGWLWEPYLLVGGVTLLTSQWKSGKTTLVSVLLTQTHAGGSLAGSPVRRGRAVIVSEESRAVWAGRAATFAFGDSVRWLCRPFRGQPTVAEWFALVKHLAADPPDLLVIDPLAAVLPAGVELNVAAAHAALAPLHDLTDAGTSVLLLHHPRKTETDAISPRGTGALTAFADVVVEMDRPPGDANARRRRLRSTSRVAGPAARVIELDAAGTAYAPVGETATADDYDTGWPVLKGVLEDTPHRMTRAQIHAAWPKDHPRPSERTLLRWLERSQAAGLVERRGQGRRYMPFLYTDRGHRDLWPDLPPLEPLPVPEPDPEELRDRDAMLRELVLTSDAKLAAMQAQLQAEPRGRAG